MRRVVLFALALVACAAALAPAARAATGPSFALEPLAQSARVGYFVLDTRPGRTVETRVRVINKGDRAGMVRLYAVDATTGQTSGAVYRNAGDPRRGVGMWTALSVRRMPLAPGESRVVDVRVAVPESAGPGEHLGGIVAEDEKVRRGREARRRGGRFRIDVRALTVSAVQVNLPGPRERRMSIGGIRAGGSGGYQTLLLGLRNEGNVLQKGAAAVTVRDGEGRRVQRARFELDTFVARTGIEYPVQVRGRALPKGDYSADVVVRYSGREVRKTIDFSISDEQVGQVFGSRPTNAPEDDDPTWLFVLGGLALLGLGFGSAAYVFRRRERSLREAAVRAPSGTVEPDEPLVPTGGQRSDE